jgi:hypothetical protein
MPSRRQHDRRRFEVVTVKSSPPRLPYGAENRQIRPFASNNPQITQITQIKNKEEESASTSCFWAAPAFLVFPNSV